MPTDLSGKQTKKIDVEKSLLFLKKIHWGSTPMSCDCYHGRLDSAKLAMKFSWNLLSHLEMRCCVRIFSISIMLGKKKYKSKREKFLDFSVCLDSLSESLAMIRLS